MSWKAYLLAEFLDEGGIDIKTGPFGTQLRASDYTPEGTPVINVRNVGYGDLRPDKLEFVPDQVVLRLSQHILKTQDIVFGRKGAVDRHLLVGESETGWMQGSDCIRLRVLTDKINPAFLSFTFRLSRHRQWMITQCSNKATMASLNQDVIARIPINLPDPTTQAEIVSILSAYDDLIENNRRRIELLEQAARLLYKEWFVHFRFPGHEHVKIVDGVPEGWGYCGMMEHPYFEFIRENISRYDGVKKYYATADVMGITITGDGLDYRFEEKPSRAQKAPEINSVWFARMQETYKVLVFTETNSYLAGNSMLSSGFAGFRTRRPDLLPFLYLTINNDRFHEEKDCFCTGATQRSLTNGGLKNIQAMVPTDKVVLAFALKIAPLIDQILILQDASEKLRAARDLLLPRLMNGELPL